MHVAYPVDDEFVGEGFAGKDGALRDAGDAVSPRRVNLADAVPVDGGVLGLELVVNGDDDGVSLRGADGRAGSLAIDGHGELLEAVGGLVLVRDVPRVVVHLRLRCHQQQRAADDDGGNNKQWPRRR